jgi:hypothetical protein
MYSRVAGSEPEKLARYFAAGQLSRLERQVVEPDREIAGENEPDGEVEPTE